MVVLWASELTAPPAPDTTTTAAVISLPSFPSPNTRPVATLPTAKPHAVALETCFERNYDEYWAARHAVIDEYALDGEFATGVAGTPIILALYKPQDGKIWDYAERCNSAAYYQQAKAVKKLRTASWTKDFPDWREDGPFGGGGSFGKHPGGIGPSTFGYVPLGNIFTFGGGGGGGGGKGTSGGGSGGDKPGNSLVGDTGPGGDTGNPDDKNNSDPNNGNPTNPGGHGPETGDPAAVPEPGTLAVLLGVMAGFGLMRRRALNKSVLRA